MPALGMQFLPRPELLTSDELPLVVRAAPPPVSRRSADRRRADVRPDLVELVRATGYAGIEHVL
jgi:cyclic pyranopterin phosphate synthase